LTRSQLLQITIDKYAETAVKQIVKQLPKNTNKLPNNDLKCIKDLVSLKIKMDKEVEKCVGRAKIKNCKLKARY